MLLNPYDRDALKAQFNNAKPYRWFQIDPFLEPKFADEVQRAYPTFEQSRALGFEFNAVNEQRKVQITDSSKFSEPVKRLSEALASPQFLADLEYITGIPKLMADPQLSGGGMHLTGPGGRLDVHVDFNYLEDRKIHRRLNILVYLNPRWEPGWGGEIELWDDGAKNRYHSFAPELGRCVVFETSNISYHGVGPVKCPPDVARKSFAAYYYTAEAPPHWTGKGHSTIFRARPTERLRGMVLMPLESARRSAKEGVRGVKRRVKQLLQIK